MVKDEIIQTICTNLNKHINKETVKFVPGCGLLKYVFHIKKHYFEITYYFTDDFYRIKVENISKGLDQDVVFLTKSKKFHRQMKCVLKELKLSKKSFKNHVICFTHYLNKLLENYSDLNYLIEFNDDLKFDGVFI